MSSLNELCSGSLGWPEFIVVGFDKSIGSVPAVLCEIYFVSQRFIRVLFFYFSIINTPTPGGASSSYSFMLQVEHSAVTAPHHRI